MKTLINILVTIIGLLNFTVLYAEDGYRLWLRYDVVKDQAILDRYNKQIQGWIVEGDSPVLKVAENELQIGLEGLLGRNIPSLSSVKKNGIVLAGTPSGSPLVESLKLKDKLSGLGSEGYIILNTKYRNKKVIVIAANNDAGVLYGIFHFLRLLQTDQPITGLSITSYAENQGTAYESLG